MRVRLSGPQRRPSRYAQFVRPMRGRERLITYKNFCLMFIRVSLINVSEHRGETLDNAAPVFN